MEDKNTKFNYYLPLHLWNLKALSKDRIIKNPIIKSKKCNTIILSEKMNKPCSKILSKW